MASQPLPPDQLYRSCDPGALGFQTTAALTELEEAVVGQPRVVEAVQFGIGMDNDGYNLFALGPNALGKYTTVRRFLEQRAAQQPAAADWCYIHNFQAPHQPRALRLPPGTAAALRADMERLIEETRSSILAAFDSEDYQHRRAAIEEEFRERQAGAFEDLQQRARAQRVTLMRTPMGVALAPLKGDQVITPEAFAQLPQPEREQAERTIAGLQAELSTIMQQMPQLDRQRRRRLRELEREVTNFAIGFLIDVLRTKYAAQQAVVSYLDEVRNDLLEQAPALRAGADGAASGELPRAPRASAHDPAARQRYTVNVLVDHADADGVPVIYEDNPTLANLVGRIEHLPEMGALVTDFTLIKAGALHRANGGYLMLDARKLLQQPYAWEALKRALKSHEIRIESLAQALSFVSTISLDPQPIPTDLKVVLIGDRRLYYLLCAFDPEFTDLFKVAVDFEEEMERTAATTQRYARLLASVIRRRGLRPFDAAAVARVIEQASRIAGDAQKVTIHFGGIVELLEEADYWARQGQRDVVGREAVQRAIDAQVRRADRLRERAQEAILRNTLLIDTDGAKVGQINGLAVLQLGALAFGKPNRISARVRIGRGDVVDIEREVELGGPLHSKGVLILTSFLAARYAAERPLSLSASLVFEQSYGGVDGDSASSAELYALLSALSDLPINQGLAVTGSVNQFGEVQAIGGVNEKIEGFFDICAARGLTGNQGVLIPAANVTHLMLRADVVASAAAGRFAIYPIATIDQGIALLTATPAGEPDSEGAFGAGTVNALVQSKLAALAAARSRFMAADGNRQDAGEGADSDA